MRLKAHESPRHRGRNDKGKGGSARKRQLDKRFKTTVQRLKDNERSNSSPSTSSQSPDHNRPSKPSDPYAEQVPYLLFFLILSSLNDNSGSDHPNSGLRSLRSLRDPFRVFSPSGRERRTEDDTPYGGDYWSWMVWSGGL